MIHDNDQIYWVYGDDKRSEGWRNKFGCESFEIAMKVANGWIDMGALRANSQSAISPG